MSWYRMVDVRIHGDAKFLTLSPELPSGRTLFKHLLICEENGPLPGVVRAGAAALAEALEWSPEQLRERFGELFREGLAEADWRARLVFLPNGIKYNPPNNPNVVAGWSKHWDALPEGDLKRRIWARFYEFFFEDSERRVKEIESGERDKKQDPSAMLSAFLKAMPEPAANPVETVPGTVTPTVPGTVGGFSAGARARLPEPEPEHKPEPEQKAQAVARAREEGAPPPDPRVSRAAKGGNGGLPGEDQLEELAEALWNAHPTGVRRQRVETERVLLQLLRTGRIWLEDSPPVPPAPPGFGMAFPGPLLARHAEWCVVWRPRGDVPPMNLPQRWLAKLEFLDLPPPQEGKSKGGNGDQAATVRRWGSSLAPGTTQADVDRARAWDDTVFGPREG